MPEESGDNVLPNEHQADEKTTELIEGLMGGGIARKRRH
ncbi:hypothetical protein Halhy_1682 [Haliscomenobacter hydrossis DSM 1100]|uniref:Uncharacterized protein n=1 Tax=Haliscomenobacter hydrossis (strain ATCC 27775 / DSM 1100 / LMG 10767 / O) TaxID=760192 RepID=F4L1R2_HALH1|nr:hypothetical protein Halhy_1682 [Haliscomenobacter hydrossis DSM 1100]